MRTAHISRAWRFCALLLSVIMMFGVLTACQGGGETAATETDTQSETETDVAVDTNTETTTEDESDTETVTDTETDTDTDTEVAPEPVTYTITVTDENGAPLQGAMVQVCVNAEDGVCFIPDVTDENGVFTMQKEPGSYKAKVTLAGYETNGDYTYFDENNASVTIMMYDVSTPLATSFTVSNVFSDHMVLQRNEHVRLWGWADESQNGHRVTAEFLGTRAQAVIENGEWELTFKTQWAANTSMGNTLTVSGDGVSYEFHDVLVGDVYMAIGQSNIEYTMSTHLANTPTQWHGDIDENALIRLHLNHPTMTPGNYPTQGTTEECREIGSSSRWSLPTESNYRNFSALAYYFAYHLLETNGNTVPVGVIEVAYGGLSLSCFLSNEVADATDADTWNKSKGIYTTQGTAPEPTPSRYMYNHYIAPFERYAIAGLIWYQGESDLHDANTKVYAEKFVPLMKQMREDHNVLNKNFPIYFVEFPTCYVGDWKFGGVRAIQGQIASQMLENCYLSVSSDLLSGTGRDVLHPEIKWQQAQRLASIAAYVEYGIGTADETLGPVLVSIELSSDKKTAVLTYANVGEGLKTIDGSEKVKGFMVYKKNYYALTTATVNATITAPNQITVTSSARFEGVGYNTVVTNFFGVGRDLNLCNSFDVPAGAVIIYPTTEEA